MNIMDDFWSSTLRQIRSEIPEQQFTTWIKPLQAEIRDDGVVLTAPNRFILQWVRDRFLRQIEERAKQNGIASIRLTQRSEPQQNLVEKLADAPPSLEESRISPQEKHRLNPNFTFSTFIAGKANQLARAAALQVAENPGAAYNPLFVYGGVGLGKTHLIQAIGNQILERQPNAKVRYVHAEKYVSDVVRAYQHKSFDSFKRYYHSLDLLMIDDIQFFGGKARTQEEFFFAFNALVESHRQVIITCDSFPKEIAGMEERLISRFGWGLTVAIEPPELEMRVAILINKARLEGLSLDEDVAFFIAKHIRSNVRELEGALKRVQAYSRFKGDAISLQSTREALKDLLALQHRQISIENIQKTVADYYKIKVGDMFSKKRTRALARPRQMAMALAKDITNLSLPDIGDAFGGRDHTTVLHACRKMQELCETDNTIQRDFLALQQILNG
ncbi:MAG: chromosomal replication initiator protein DnaA [Betaproteobacteria bacterium]|nr:chromosomal replication initiator protein DnaA [Betaproteobacteria bacterium]MDE1981400.1 chromosomal replication initiator protein DnaA [Betaproteobacteria bacterium]MDE2211881.1 chromosomal replication initiator protein DnaA [Betaproteobacteria bacterium]MDE2624082.1 chromosomal replication initiator protein DnaA [Betaproteobacteria bacterium]